VREKGEDVELQETSGGSEETSSRQVS
jgi:hypothetical protein